MATWCWRRSRSSRKSLPLALICLAFQTGCGRCNRFRRTGNRSASRSTKRLAIRDKDLENLRAVSPLFHADKIVKPLIVLQGANDPRVIKPESDEIVENIKKRSGAVEYVLFDNEGHGFTKKANEIRAYKAILDFLDRYLKNDAVSSMGGGGKKKKKKGGTGECEYDEVFGMWRGIF